MKAVGSSDPAHIGPFRCVAVLGQGGMGRVLLGVGPDGRFVAVKQVHTELAEDEGFRARFRREVAASRKVSGAFTAPVVDADPEAPTPWLASPRCSCRAPRSAKPWRRNLAVWVGLGGPEHAAATCETEAKEIARAALAAWRRRRQFDQFRPADASAGDDPVSAVFAVPGPDLA